MTTPKRGLGKGLDALFTQPAPTKEETPGVTELRITTIEPNRDQPRKLFRDDQLAELANSIREHGIIQPIVVTKQETGFYQIIAGERRWRAAKMAGLNTIPAVVREYNEKEASEISLIENLQRENLNPIEEAEGYKNLISSYGMTQEQISERIGKSRSTIANSLRLLSLNDIIKGMVENGKLSGGHARALLAVENENKRIELAKKVIEEQLSVRELERIVSQKEEPADPKKPIKKERQFEAEFQSIENKLSGTLGTKVKISHGSKKGKIEIEYYGTDDLNRILTYFG